MQLITEALNRKRLENNFRSFFNEFTKYFMWGGLIERIVLKFQAIFYKYFSYIVDQSSLSLVIVDELKSKIVLKTAKEFEDLIPNIYMEKIISELKKLVNVNNEEEKTDLVKYLSNEAEISYRYRYIIERYALLSLFRHISKELGLSNNLNSFIINVEEQVYKNQIAPDEMLNQFLNELEKVAKNKEEKEKNRMSNYLIFRDDQIEVYKVDSSHEACIMLGKGTNWCVTMRDERGVGYYKEYSSYGDMYVVIFKGTMNEINTGPQKILITVKNKVMDKYNKKMDELLGILQNIEFKDFTVESLKFVRDGEDVSKDFQEFIEMYKKVSSKLNNFYDWLIETRELFFLDVFNETLQNHLIFPPKEDLNVEDDRKFFDSVNGSVLNFIAKIFDNYYNIENVNKYLNAEFLKRYSLLFDFLKKYIELSFSTTTSLTGNIVEKGTKDQVEYDVQKIKSLMKELEDFYVSDLDGTFLIINDSSNNPVKLNKAPFSKTLRWPKMNEIINEIQEFKNNFNKKYKMMKEYKKKINFDLFNLFPFEIFKGSLMRNKEIASKVIRLLKNSGGHEEVINVLNKLNEMYKFGYIRDLNIITTALPPFSEATVQEIEEKLIKQHEKYVSSETKERFLKEVTESEYNYILAFLLYNELIRTISFQGFINSAEIKRNIITLVKNSLSYWDELFNKVKKFKEDLARVYKSEYDDADAENEKHNFFARVNWKVNKIKNEDCAFCYVHYYLLKKLIDQLANKS